MKVIVRIIGVCLLVVFASNTVLADVDRYRIAGIIAFGTTDWRAIVELPDGEQQLVIVGQHIGDAVVVEISEEGVTLQFPGGKERIQLSQDDYVPLRGDSMAVSETPTQPMAKNEGLVASDFNKLVEKRFAPELLESVRGLETLHQLPVSARIVSYSYLGGPDTDSMPLNTMDVLQEAILTGKELRMTVQGGDSVTNFYVMPKHPE